MTDRSKTASSKMKRFSPNTIHQLDQWGELNGIVKSSSSSFICILCCNCNTIKVNSEGKGLGRLEIVNDNATLHVRI
jgi:hypothetical protein